MPHPTVAQNKAHREDLVWVKTARGGEYMNSAGYVIRQNVNTRRWEVFAPSGDRASYTLPHRGGRTRPILIGSHSLTEAKSEVERHFGGQSS